MYINKKLYLFLKAVAIVGMYWWGSLIFQIFGILLGDLFADFAEDSIFTGFADDTFFQIKMYICLFSISILLFIVHFWLNKRLANANIYNSLFVNDPDGVIQLPVLSRAMGKKASELKKDIIYLIKMKILKNCRFGKDGNYENIVLFKDTGSKSLDGGEIKAVCSSCGGETMVRIGYVKSCPYCGSKLDT